MLAELIKLSLIFDFLDGQAFSLYRLLRFHVLWIALLIVLADKVDALSFIAQITRCLSVNPSRLVNDLRIL